MQIRKRLVITLVISIAILLISLFFSISIGTATISFSELTRIISSLFGLVPYDQIEPTQYNIISQVRLPRVLLALMVGGGLSVVGAVMQSIFRNPMAEPGILGWSSGGAFFAVFLIYSGLAVNYAFILPLGAFIGTLITSAVIYKVSTIKNETPNTILLLTGITIGALFVSLTSLVLILADVWSVRDILFWLMGGLDSSGWHHVKIAWIPIIIGSIGIMLFSRDLNALLIGDDAASTLGINVKSTKTWLLILSSLVVGACVSVSGIIGFVGLVIPHMLRLILGADNRLLLPASFIIGASFLSIADLIARTLISPEELRLGIITSFVGVPFFIYLLRKNRFKISGLYE